MGLQVEEGPKPVVAVDDPSVEVVQIGGGEPAALQRDERPKVRRQHRNDVHDHPAGIDARPAKGVDDLEALGELLPLGDGGGLADFDPQLLVEGFQVEPLEHRLDGLRPDAGFELVAEGLQGLPVLFVREQLTAGELRFLGVDDDVAVEVEHLLHVL